MRIWILGVMLAGIAIAQPTLRVFSDPKQPITPLSMAEDAKGNLWIAAEQGVFRFDGNGFQQIPGDFQIPGSITALGGEIILIGASNGLFQYRVGEIKRLSNKPVGQIVPVESDFAFVCNLDSPNTLDAAILTGAQLAIVPQTAAIAFPIPYLDGFAWQPDDKLAIRFTKRSGLLAAALAGQVTQYIRESGVEILRLKTSLSLVFLSLNPDGWNVMKGKSDVFLDFAGQHGEAKRVRVGLFSRSHREPLPYADREGKIWVPGDYLWAVKGEGVEKFQPPQLVNRQVTLVFEDSRGRHWFGLTGAGLAVMGMEPAMESWRTPMDYGEINALTRQDPKTLYAATYKGVLLRRRGDAPWEELARGKDSPPVSQVVGGSHGRLMGLVRLGPPVEIGPDGKILHELAVPPKVDVKAMRRMVRAPDGAYYIGSQESEPYGFYRISEGRVEALQLPKGGSLVQDIAFGYDGRVYAGFAGGVCRMESSECRPVIAVADGLASEKVRGIGIGPQDEIWVVYREGAVFTRLQNIGGKWQARQFTEKDGYFWPESTFIKRDRRGWVWRGSGVGLWVSDGKHVEPQDWIQITEREGLPSSIVGRFGWMEDDDGSVWIGTAAGIAHLHPSQDWFQGEGAPRISSLRYGKESYAEQEKFPHSFRGPSELVAAFSRAGLLPLQYRLWPLDRQWRLSREGEVSYPKLEAGSYRLEALGRRGSLASYSFEVTDPAQTQRHLAWLAGSALLGLGLVVALQRRQRKRLEVESRVLPYLGELRMAALVPDSQLLTGKSLDGRFTPWRVLARGGFATVYEGQDHRRNCRCAIKVFHREVAGQGLARRFQQEVAALESIEHPNVVAILGFGSAHHGAPYLAMEFIEGQTLREALPADGMDRRRVARLLRQAGSALAAMHAKGIFHRDLKPENLMIRQDGQGGEQLVLIDFSIALVKDPEQTVHGISRAAGTLQYMAPEQVMGYADASTDIYSLAKVTLEMLTGKRLGVMIPDASMDLPARVRGLIESLQSPFSKDAIDRVAAALEFDPVRRPKDALAFAAALAADLERR